MSKMVKIEATRHQVALAGQVTDKQTGRTIDGAQIEVTSAPPEFTDWLDNRRIQYGDRWNSMVERPDRTRTEPDGHFHFIDLPDGEYTLTASLPGVGSRYGTAQLVVTVSRDDKGNINMAQADIALPPTTIKGKISKQSAESVPMAEVRVKGSGERVFSNSKGEYLMAGLEKGKRTVLVSAQGFKEASQTAQLNRGAVHTLNFTLLPAA